MNYSNRQSADYAGDGGHFARSLASLRPEEIRVGRSAPKKSRSELVSFGVRMLAIVLCLTVFVYCVVVMVQNLLSYAESQNYYDQLISDIWESEGDLTANPFGNVSFSERDYIHGSTADYASSQSADGPSSSVVIGDSDEMLRIKAKLGALYAQNNDLIAWITIPNTIINYPVVLTDNNEYYLHHNFQKAYLFAGTVFADYRNSGSLMDNYNTILYGHNLSTGMMFTCLGNYFTRSFYEAHPNIYIYTTEGIYTYEIFNISKVASTSNYIRTYFKTPEDFVEFATEKASESVFKKKGLTFTGEDRILTLSTCTNAHNPAERYCIQAVLTEIRK